MNQSIDWVLSTTTITTSLKASFAIKTSHEEEAFYRSGDISGDRIDSVWNDRSVWNICQKTALACDWNDDILHQRLSL